MFAGCRRLRRIWRNGKALFRHLLLQIGGANIAGRICSLRSLRCSLVAAVFVGSGGTEKRCSAISSCRSAARTSRVEFARSARCDVRWLPPSSLDLAERKSVVPPSPPADRRREHRGSNLLAPLAAMFAGCRRLRWIWRNGKALFRHLLLQIGGANIAGRICSLRSLRCSLVAAVFVGSGGTEKRCSAISSCRSAARTSRVEFARSARCDVRWLPPSSSDLAERKSVVPPSPPADRRREHRGSNLLAPLAAMFAGCRRLRWIWRNGKALFRQLLLQIGGANIAGLICSLRSLRCSLGCRRLRRSWRNGKALLPAPPADRRREHRGSNLLAPLAAMFAELPPSSSEL